MKNLGFSYVSWTPNVLQGALDVSFVFTGVQRGRPHRAQAKPPVLRASFFDGGREGFNRGPYEPPRPRTNIEGAKSSGFACTKQRLLKSAVSRARNPYFSCVNIRRQARRI